MDISKVNTLISNQEQASAPKNPTLNKSPLPVNPPKEPIGDDIISISQEAKALRAAEESLTADIEKIKEIEEMLQELKEASNVKDSPLYILLKCLKIATRIMKGNRVPSEDQQFLAENEPGLYANALLLQRQNANPQKWDSLLEDEDSNPEIEANASEVIPNETLNKATEIPE